MSRIKVTQQVVFQFDELDDRGKERAREWMRRCEHESWDGTDCYDDLTNVLGYLGFEANTRTDRWRTVKGKEHSVQRPDFTWQLSYSQGDGFSFDGKWSAENVNMAALVADFTQDETLHRLCAQLMALRLRWPQSFATITSSSWSVDALTGDLDGDGDPIDMPADDAKVLSEAARSLCRWCYEYLRDDLDGRLSDESIEEQIKANEYEFDEDGDRV